jgi:hypothetical protein
LGSVVRIVVSGAALLAAGGAALTLAAAVVAAAALLAVTGAVAVDAALALVAGVGDSAGLVSPPHPTARTGPPARSVSTSSPTAWPRSTTVIALRASFFTGSLAHLAFE